VAVTIVQTKAASGEITLDAPVTAGNTLILMVARRDTGEPSDPFFGGFTEVAKAINSADFVRSAGMWHRVGTSDETAVTKFGDGLTYQLGAATDRGLLVEIVGEYASVVAEKNTATGAAMDCGGTVTPPSSEDALVVGIASVGWSDLVDPGDLTEDSGVTAWVDSYPTASAPRMWAGYRQVSAPSAVTVGGSISNPDAAARSWCGVTAVFVHVDAPEPGVWMDFGGNGFGDDTTDAEEGLLARIFPEAGPAGVSDNVTARVLNLEWERGGSYDSVSPAGPGGATITLKNHDGRFDPDNASGPLFGKLVPGIPVWCGADRTTASLTTATEVRGFFAGYVREWVPTVDSRGERVVEVICEDAFGRYRRTPVTVAASLTRSQSDLRQAILTAAGESTDRLALESEPGMLPISAVDGEDALSVLEDLNKATASRHFIAPADTKEAWYDYTLVNKYHKLASAVDETWNGDDIQNVSGWRVTNANVIEQQRASVTPITLTPNNAVVWEAEGLPVTVRNARPYSVIAEFDDYVFSPTLDISVTSGSVYSEIEGFGKTARIRVWSAGVGVISSLRVLGQQVERGDSEQVIAGDTTAGAVTGSPISSDYIGQTAAAQGVCDYIVWKFSTPLKRPKLIRKRKDATTTASIFDRDLFDVVDVVIDELSVTSRRLEIVGLKGSWRPGGDISLTYECQETPNQSAIHWFTVGTDTVGSSVPIAPF
jgi:hypothetical protein